MNLALFDFDGTITKKDSLPHFIQYAVGKRSYYFGLIKMSPILIAYVLKIVSNHYVKEKLISHFFKGWGVDEFKAVASNYSLNEIKSIVRPKAQQKIKWHKEKGDLVVVVSASVEAWLSSWCEKQDVLLIGTTLKVVNHKLTGEFLSKNCHGIEKVKRIKAELNLDKYETIYAYGDSSGDIEMLALSDKRFYKYF